MNRVRMLVLAWAVTALLCISPGSAAAATATFHADALGSFNKRAAAANPDNWRFVFMGDNRGNDGKFRKALKLAARFDPLFILHGGDIVERGIAEELAHFLETVRSEPGLPPLFVVRGNHEMNPGLFEQYIGPRNFILDNQRLNFRLVAVDNADNSLKRKELEFLATKLDGRRPNQFVTMHVPPKTARWSRHSFEKGKDELIKMLAERNVKLGLFAHIHLFDQDVVAGVPCVISGGAGANLSYLGYSGIAKYHIVLVEVKKGKVSYRIELVD